MCYSEWMYCLSFSSIVIESRKVLTTCQLKNVRYEIFYEMIKFQCIYDYDECECEPSLATRKTSTTIVLNASSFENYK